MAAFGARPSGDRLARAQRSPQFRDGTFQNPIETRALVGGWAKALRRQFGKEQRVPPGPLPVLTRQPSDYATPPQSGLRVTWFGHSSTLIEIDGQEWLHPDSVAADRKHTLKVLAVDAATGTIAWERTAYEGAVYDARHRRGSFAGPTAATDGTTVFAYFGPEGLYAYDLSGGLKWKVVQPFKTLGLGTGTSPVLYQNLVIIQRDEDEGKESAIVAYDKANGREVWRTRRPVQISWSTPARVSVAAGTELVANGSEFVISYDPATGRELWRTKGVESNAIHTPLVGKGLVIVTAGYPAKKVIAIRPGPVDKERRVAWEYAKGTGYVLSNMLYGDYVYLLTDNGVVTCLDAATGAVKYEGGRPATPARFMGSPVAFNGWIALTSEDGQTFMLQAGPAHRIGHTNTVDEPVYSSPALADGRIYIRGERHLFAIASAAR